MKRIVFFIAIAVGVMMASCSLDQQSQYTPQLKCYNLICHHADSLYIDTLKIDKMDDNGVYKMKAIHKGDTVRAVIILNAVTNTLTGFSIAYDSTELVAQVDSVSLIQSALLDTSDPEHGKLYFKPAYNYAAFPIHYIPLKTGALDLKLTVESDSKYSPSTLSMTQPVE